MSQFTFSNAPLEGGMNGSAESSSIFHHTSNDNGVNNDNAINNDLMGGVFASSELNAPEYSTDDFRMFSFKVSRCGKRFVHDWRSCPFAHPTENARRRDPRVARYLPVPCPDYKRGICMRGDACPYSHGVYECWLHPAKYRTQLCKEGPACRRPVCFFAHSVGDLRQPTHVWTAGGEYQLASSDNPTNPRSQSTAAGALLSTTGNGGGDSSDTPAMNVARHLQSVAEEALNNGNMYNASMDGSQIAIGSAPRNADTSPVQARAASMDLRHSSNVNTSPSINGGADRLSLDGGMMTMQQTVNNSSSAPNQQSNWAQSLAASASAAVALNGIPVNEQPLLSNHGPRMSNAVARKLGLAPGKSAGAESNSNANTNTSTNTNANSNTYSSSNSSTNSVLQSDCGTQARSLPQVPHQSQVSQHRPVSMDGIGVPSGNLSMAAVGQPRRHSLHYPVNTDLNYLFDYENGGNASMGMANPASHANAGGYSLPPPSSDALGIHPALLNLVASHLAGGKAQEELFDANMNGNGNADAGLASIMEVMNRWGLGNGEGIHGRVANNANGTVTGTTTNNNGLSQMVTYPHRTSSEGVLGPSSSLPGPSPNPYMLPVDLVDIMGSQHGGNNLSTNRNVD
jgi:hypothetical protein